MDMVMSWIFLGLVGISLGFSLAEGTGGALSAAVAKGAQDGITLSISMAGALCLWSGVGKLMEKAGIAEAFGEVVSSHALKAFEKSGISFAYGKEVEYIILHGPVMIPEVRIIM